MTCKISAVFGIAASLMVAAKSFGTVNTNYVSAFSYAGTNVTTGAYVTAIASTVTSVGNIEVCDTSTKIVKVAVGAAGSEQDVFTAPVSGCIVVGVYIPGGSRLSLKAVDANATAGYNLMSLLP